MIFFASVWITDFIEASKSINIMFEIQIYEEYNQRLLIKKTNELSDKAWHVHIYVNILTKLFVSLSFQRISVLYVDFLFHMKLKRANKKNSETDAVNLVQFKIEFESSMT